MFNGLFQKIKANRIVVIVLWVCVIVGASSGITQIKFSSDYKVFFDEQNVRLQAFENLQNTYDSSDNVLIAVTSKQGDVFNEQTLSALEFLTKEAWQTPYSSRVDSPINYQYSWSKKDEFFVGDLVPQVSTLTPEEILQIREKTIKEPQILNKLISPDGKVAAVNITIRLPGVMRETEVPEVASFVRDLLDRTKNNYSGIELYASGQVMMNNALVEASSNDLSMLFPLTLTLILLGVGIFTRSILTVLTSFLVIVSSIVIAIGIAGWLGIPFSPPVASAPTIILTIAIADCTHLLVSYYRNLRSGLDRQKAMNNALQRNYKAILITSLTTAAGFLTLNMSDSPPFRHLGTITAFGVIAAFALSVSFIPAFVTLFKNQVKQVNINAVAWTDVLCEWLYKRRQTMLVLTAILLMLIVWGLPKNIIDDVFYDYFDDSFEVRKANDFIFDNLTGIATLEYEITSGRKNGISDPAFLRRAEQLSNWFKAQREVYQVNVLPDILKRINKNMHGDDPTAYRLPETKDLSAQYLLLYEMSLPYGLSLDNQINMDKSAIRMVVTARKMSSESLLALADRADEYIESNNFSEMVKGPVSPDIMFGHIGHKNNRSLLQGTLIAFLAISVILMVTLRSVKIGFISLIPNILPVALAFALWGFFVGEIGLSVSVVGAMTLGIVVDDTVHIITKYLQARRELELMPLKAIQHAYRQVSLAISSTTVSLVAGFLVLAMSPFKLNSDMGLMTSLTISLALLLDFLLLPVLFYILDGAHEVKEDPVSG